MITGFTRYKGKRQRPVISNMSRILLDYYPSPDSAQKAAIAAAKNSAGEWVKYWTLVAQTIVPPAPKPQPKSKIDIALEILKTNGINCSKSGSGAHICVFES